jgi:hypothetical protein
MLINPTQIRHHVHDLNHVVEEGCHGLSELALLVDLLQVEGGLVLIDIHLPHHGDELQGWVSIKKLSNGS